MISTTRNIYRKTQIWGRFGCKLKKDDLEKMVANKRHSRLINKCHYKTLLWSKFA